MQRRLFAILFLLPLAGCQMFDYMTGNTPAVAVKKMEDPDFADERRDGINDLIGGHWNWFGVNEWAFARKPPYTTRYGQIAQDDTDYVARMAAVRALNISRDKDSTKIFISALNDPNEWVRLEGAKALNNIPDPTAVPALLKIVQKKDENRNVRIAAAEALRHYRTIEVARTLVAVLNEREFGVAFQARESLKSLTGQDRHYDQSAWLDYLTGSQKPFG